MSTFLKYSNEHDVSAVCIKPLIGKCIVLRFQFLC